MVRVDRYIVYQQNAILFNVSSLPVTLFLTIVSAVTSYTLLLYENHPRQQAVLQVTYVAYAVSATLAPFIATPFLVTLNTTSINNTSMYNTSFSEINHNKNHTYTSCEITAEDMDQWNNKTLPTSKDSILTDINETMEQQKLFELPATADMSRVCLVYLMFGTVLLLPFGMFFVGFLLTRDPLCHKKVKTSSENKQKMFSHPPVTLRIILWLCMGTYCMLGRILWVVPGDLIASIMVKFMGWTVKSASWLTGVFWFGYLAGNAFATLASIFVTSASLTRLCIFVTLSAFLTLCFLPFLPEFIIWISIFFTGAGQSPLFPATLIWLSDYIPSSGFSTGMYLFLVSIGGTATSSIVPLLFDKVSSVFIMMIPMVCAAIVSCSLLFMQLSAWLLVKSDADTAEVKDDNITAPLKKDPV